MTNTKSTMYRAALVAAAIAIAPLAFAGPSPASPEVKTALAKAAEGPDTLRRYIQRTRMIYALNYFEVMQLHEAAKAANAVNAAPPGVATATVR